jgi:transposase-like protein
VRLDGTKDLIAIGDGLRASKTCWLELLRDQKVRGLDIGPCRVVGSGALGFWATLDEIDPETRRQRCWGHKAANVLNALPRSVKVKAQLLEIWMAPTRAQAVTAVERFVQRYQAKYPKAVDEPVTAPPARRTASRVQPSWPRLQVRVGSREGLEADSRSRTHCRTDGRCRLCAHVRMVRYGWVP